MSSMVTRWPGARRSGRSASLIRALLRLRSLLAASLLLSLARPGRRGLHVGSAAGPYRRDLGQIVDLRLEAHRDPRLVADDPDVVVDGSGRVRHVAGLDVEQIPPERVRHLVRVVG